MCALANAMPLESFGSPFWVLFMGLCTWISLDTSRFVRVFTRNTLPSTSLVVHVFRAIAGVCALGAGYILISRFALS